MKSVVSGFDVDWSTLVSPEQAAAELLRRREQISESMQFYGDPRDERIAELEAELLEVRTCLVIAMSFWPAESMKEHPEQATRCRRSQRPG